MQKALHSVSLLLLVCVCVRECVRECVYALIATDPGVIRCFHIQRLAWYCFSLSSCHSELTNVFDHNGHLIKIGERSETSLLTKIKRKAFPYTS